MKSAIPVIVFVLAVMVTLPQSVPAQPAEVIVCSGSNLNCYYAPANIKLPATCFKGADTYGGRLVFRCDARTTTMLPPDLGPAQKQLRAGPPPRSGTIGVRNIGHAAGAASSGAGGHPARPRPTGTQWRN
jgi:hypothetical protein